MDLGWVVGFLEGEGTFALQTPGTTGTYAYPSIRAAQVQRWPIDRLQDLLGGRINRRPSRGNANPCWMWYRNGRDVEEILVALKPLFSPRRQEQIQTVLDGVKRGRAPKLSYELAQEIRASDAEGIALAERYGVTPQAISMVRRNQIWLAPAAGWPARGPTTGARSKR